MHSTRAFHRGDYQMTRFCYNGVCSYSQNHVYELQKKTVVTVKRQDSCNASSQCASGKHLALFSVGFENNITQVSPSSGKTLLETVSETLHRSTRHIWRYPL